MNLAMLHNTLSSRMFGISSFRGIAICSASMISTSVPSIILELSSSGSLLKSIKLLWKTSLNGVQFPVLEGSMLLQSKIVCKAYLNYSYIWIVVPATSALYFVEQKFQMIL